MAAALFNMIADPSKARAISAGSRPADRVHPEVVAVMNELGIDLSAAVPQRLTAELAGTAQHLITMGCSEACPLVPGLTPEDWPLADPAGLSLERIREIREEIRSDVVLLIERHGWS